MAKATKAITKEQVVTTIEVEQFVLTLSKDEARTLMDIFAMVGGSPTKTRRRHTDEMALALRAAGARHTPDAEGTCYPADISPTAHSIYFT
jgi:hypothetical protein